MSEEAISRFHIITGGPCSGKSSLNEALAAGGLATMPEAGRAIIRQQVAIGGTALPWQDRLAFAELMLAWEIRSHEEAHQRSGHVIFDRGVPDVIGYLELSGLPVPAHMEAAAKQFTYHAQVFIAPPWPEIYRQDAERQQDLAEAEATYHALASAYTRLGYRLIELPRVPVAARARFILDSIG